VVADIAKLTVGREAYYTRELATDHEAYLSGHGESPGRWYGAAAAALGLQGEASPAGFQRMFEGRDPTTGELLGRAHGRNAVPAFDVVLRPTKSVSILYGLGDAPTGRAVLAAQHAGVAELCLQSQSIRSKAPVDMQVPHQLAAERDRDGCCYLDQPAGVRLRSWPGSSPAMRWPRALRWRINSARARAARTAERSLLATSSKPRISSCSMSVSR